MQGMAECIAEAGDKKKSKANAEHTLARFGTDLRLDDWSPTRMLIAKVITHQAFEIALAFLVLMSLALVVIETDHNVEGVETPGWVNPIENVLLVLYCAEMASRFYVLRTHLFDAPLNIVDFAIVVIDAVFFLLRLAAVELPQVSFFRVLRLARLCRAFHILQTQPQLYMLAEASYASMKTTLFGCLFIGIALVIFGILAVEFLQPLNPEFSSTCGRCPVAFGSVYDSIISLIQTIIVGDAFGDIFMPFLDRYPPTLLFVLPVFVTVNFGLMNLIMAVIVDCAAQARLRNTKEMADEKDREFAQNQKRLNKLCERMDTNGDKTITLEELLVGYDSQPEFRRTLAAMDLDKDDMSAVFSILDEDASGEVLYTEFTAQLYKMKSNNSNTMLVFIKHYVTELRKSVTEEMSILKDQVAGGISQLKDDVSEEMMLIKEDLQGSHGAHVATDLRKALAEELRAVKNDIAGGISQMKDELGKEFVVIKDMISAGLASAEESKQLMPLEFARKLGQELMHADCGKDLDDKVLPQDRDFNTLVLATQHKEAASETTLGEKTVADGQLQRVTDQMTAAFDDLRSTCQNSVALLTTFDHVLPHLKCGNMPQAQGLNSSSGLSNMHQQGHAPDDETKEQPLKVLQLQPRGDFESPPYKRTSESDSAACHLTFKDATSSCHFKDIDDAANTEASYHQEQPQHYTALENGPVGCTKSIIQDGKLSILEAPVESTTVSHECTFDASVEQLGLQVYWIDGFPAIGRVEHNCAAEALGVLPGDRLAECNGVSILGWRREEVLKLLRDRPLRLKMLRNSDLF